MNPKKEIPVLEDDSFYLSESNVILQYLADRYAKDDVVYPKDAKTRAIVNHRLAFNLSTYYRNISEHMEKTGVLVARNWTMDITKDPVYKIKTFEGESVDLFLYGGNHQIVSDDMIRNEQ